MGIVSPYGPGAVNVASIVLDHTNWAGCSTIPGGTISGNVGEIKVKPDASLNGGTIDLLTVEGNVVGQVTAHKVLSMTIDGAYGDSGAPGHSMVVDEIDKGDLVIGSVIDANISVVSITSDGGLLIEDDTTDVNFAIGSIASGGEVKIGYNQSPGSASMSNTDVILDTSFPSGASLNFANARNLGGTITFASTAQDPAGSIQL